MNVMSIRRALPYGLLLLLYSLLVFSVQMKSLTMDEQNHIARGLAYLKTGDLRLSQEHPPGINAWQTWPLLLDPRIRLPLDSPSWSNAEWYGFADQLLWQINDLPQAMAFATRVPVMCLTLILAALLYRWTRDIGGPWAGLIALALLVFDANILAHGRLTTTDMGVACLAFAATYALWRAVGAVTWSSWIVAGIALGAALLSKFSALVLVPVTLAIAVLEWAREARSTSFSASRSTRWIARLIILYGTAFAIVWAGYAFTWGPVAALNGLPAPAPAFWTGLAQILQRTGTGTPSFLLGQHSTEGWWYYFPVAFAIKTPLPTLILLGVALALGASHALSIRSHPSSAVSTQHSSRLLDEPTAQPLNPLPYLFLPVLAFWAIALLGSFDIGYRHILPTLPFLYAFVGWQLGKWASAQALKSANQRTGTSSSPSSVVPRPSSVVIFTLLLWLAVGTLLVAPHYLAFFNAIAGGPEGGYRYLVDSNLDWGQDMPGLVAYVKQQGIDRIYLSWFGAAHPEAYDLSFHPLPGYWRFRDEPPAYGLNPYVPGPGFYAISATNLQGLMFPDHDRYAWFRERTPIADIGHSIRIYQVKEEPERNDTAVLGVPWSQVADQERTLLERASSVRRYDPTTGLIVPSAPGETWYIAPDPPEGSQVVRQGPGYVVTTGPQVQMDSPEPSAHFGKYVLPLYVEVEDASLAEDSALDIAVQWQVTRAPHRDAVSFAHLLDAEGNYLSGWDGLTAPATCWQPGDLIRQDYRIPIPANLAPGTYQVEVGWYDAETGERWPYIVGGETADDRMLVPEVEIRA